MKVLVVDDSLLIRNGLREMLLSLKHQVFLAENGEEAIALYRQERPDIVTMDLAMPKMDGSYALRHIMSMNPNAKVIMSTSNSLNQAVLESIRDGASGYILKPITTRTLDNAIKKAIDKPFRTG